MKFNDYKTKTKKKKKQAIKWNIYLPVFIVEI